MGSKSAIHSTKLTGNFGPKLNGSVRSNRKSFEKTGPPFEVVLFSRSDRLEFWLNGSRPKIPLKVRVLDTDDLKQKTSLFSVQGKSAWYCFKAVVLLFYISSVSGTKSKCPNSHHRHPRHPFIARIYREYKAQNRLIL